MLKVKFLGHSNFVKVSFSNLTEHVVQLEGDLTALNCEDGFKVYRMDGLEIGDYSAFTTIYRTLDNGYQYSNDGSHYEPPIPPPPPEPTIEDYRNAKYQELHSAYDSARQSFVFEGKTYQTNIELKATTEMACQTGIAINYQGTPAEPTKLGQIYMAQVKNGYDQDWLIAKRDEQLAAATTIKQIQALKYKITEKEAEQRDIDNAEILNFYQTYVEDLSFATKKDEKEIFDTVDMLTTQIIPEIVEMIPGDE